MYIVLQPIDTWRRAVFSPSSIVRVFLLLMAASTAGMPALANTLPVGKQPLSENRSETSAFYRVPSDISGLDFVTPLYPDHEMSYLYHSGFSTGGICIGDLNGDHHPDLFMVSGPEANALYVQSATQPLKFGRIPLDPRFSGKNAWGTGAALVDIDNDGDLDIYVCNYDSPNQLLINETTAPDQIRFVESAKAFGLDRVDASLMPSFADYDLDGDLDLYVLNNQYYRPGGRPQKPPFKMSNGRPIVLPEYSKYYELREVSPGNLTMDTYGRPDQLYRNDGADASGQIRFTDVSRAAGIEGNGHGLSATWWDFNHDRYPDLYVGNDFTEPDRLYQNNHDGTFSEVLGRVMPYCTWSSMGAAAADFNNDGRMDFFSADMAATTHFAQKVNMGDMSRHRWLMENGWPRQIMRNMLYINTGTQSFMETAWMSGVAQSDWTWAVKASDFDSDGQVDLFLCNGMARNFSDADIPMNTGMLIGQTVWERFKDKPPMPQKNIAFKNAGNLRFVDVASEWGLDQNAMSYGAATGDLDGDGDVDLVVANLGERVSLFRNDLVGGHRVSLRLRGTQSNRDGIGTTVTLTAEGREQIRYFNPTGGFLSSNGHDVVFGLGAVKKIDRLTIRWPSGRAQTLTDLLSDHRYVINESNAVLEPAQSLSTTTVPFAEVSQALNLNFRHQDRPFDDYKRQPLLPSKLSQVGPGHAWGDVNGDGRDELFVGGAQGQSGILYTPQSSGQFQPVHGPWERDAASEDMGVLWFDADVDGDLDLYVASGSVESDEGSNAYLDRIYLNQGKFRFKLANPGVLPQGSHSSSAVIGADFDGDNDIDLFVGSRSIPGKFPLTPKSHLLRNDSRPGQPKFVDVTSEVAPGLSSVGLVTGALWTDANNDGAIDLLVTTEWGGIHFYEQQEGALVDRSSDAKSGDLHGWWNSVSPLDIDHDGDLDYVVMNVGSNTKYGTAKKSKPASLYYGDMDGTGKPHLVEAKPGKGDSLPIRGLSCSATAMPLLGEKFPTFRSFASADLLDIYTPKRIHEAHHYEANTFESGILVNHSDHQSPRFEWRPLPWLAQSTPGYGVATADVNGDSFADIFSVGNHFTREPETGLWRGAPGVFLEGSSDAQFQFLMPAKTGLLAPNDTKSLSVADFDGNGRPDYLAVENNGRILAFQNGFQEASFLTIRLIGPRGNPTGIGARIILQFDDESESVGEIHGGSGYLTQSVPLAFFGIAERSPQSLTVNWPDGTQQTVALSENQRGLMQVRYQSSL